jgi:hypothetical protein
VGAYVAVAFDATWPDAAGMGQENPLAFCPARDLHAPVLATLADSPLYAGGGTKNILTSWLRIDSCHALAQAIQLRLLARETKLVLYKGFARNRRATCPETWVWTKLGSRPTKGISVGK